MFLSYLLAGFIPTSSYLILNPNLAKLVSVAVSLAALFALGFFPKRKMCAALEIAFLGGAAILVGFLVGQVFKVSSS